uniref:Uncharacterized protein n=1 Tax=Rhizophora mucronata TaxID=61149 RepID=A0A2P2QIB4_RHIMU
MEFQCVVAKDIVSLFSATMGFSFVFSRFLRIYAPFGRLEVAHT